MITADNARDVFGIHPAEAAYLLCKLSPLAFKVVEQIAKGEEGHAAIARILDVPFDSVRRRALDARRILKCPNYGFARIWYAAQFLHLYQQEESHERTEERSTDPDPRRDSD